MKGNCTKLKRFNGIGWDLISKSVTISGPSRSRETVEQEITLDCDGSGGSQEKKKSPGTKETGNIEVEVLWNPNVPTGTPQVETATAAGTVTVAGNASVTVTAAGMPGSPLVLAVPVSTGLPAVWAEEVRDFLQGTAVIAARFTVGGTGAAIVLTRNEPAANDATLNIALATGTATGVTTAATSADTTAGVAGVGNQQNHDLFEKDFDAETAAIWLVEHENAAETGTLVHATVMELGAPEYAANQTVKRTFTLEPTGEFYKHANAILDVALPAELATPVDHWGHD